MKNNRLLLLIIGLCTMFAVQAQSPEKIDFQAMARDGSGNPLIDQSVGARISIRQGSPTGTIVYQEEHTTTTDSYGLFVLAIGEGNPVLGTFSTIDWSSGDYFTQVEVDPDGSTNYIDMGTMELMSVPFALYANRAEYGEDADADPANEIQTISESGNVITLSNGGGTVTDDTEDADADPANEIQTISESGNVITLSNGGGSVTDDTEDADPANEIQTISESGNVITLSNGGGSVTDDTEDADADPANEVQTLSKTGNIITLSDVGGTGGGNVTDNVDDADANPTNELQNLSISGSNLSISSGNSVTLPSSVWGQSGSNIYFNNGNVGIGTNTPSRKFHIYNGAGSGTGTYDSNIDAVIEDNDYAYLEFNGSNLAGISFNDNNSSLNAGLFYYYGNDLLTFKTNGIFDRMVISQSGNVGIGTANPEEKLHVVGNIVTKGGEPTLLFKDTDGGGTKPTIKIENSEMLAIQGDDSNEKMLGVYSIFSSTRANDAKFRVYGSSVSTWGNWLELKHDGANGFITTDVGDLILDPEMNVGIGTTSPNYPLHVSGSYTNTAYFYNNATSGTPAGIRSSINDGGADLTSSALNGVNYSDNGFGVVGHNAWDGVGVGAWSWNGNLIEAYDGDYPYGTLEFYINQSGNTYTSGAFNTFKGIDGKEGPTHVTLKSIQSPEAWFEDFGTATLNGGQAIVNIDETFSQVASVSSGYHVFLTPISENAVQLFVAKKDNGSFTVKGVHLDGSPASCSFDYRIVANDNENKGTRFETVDIPEEVIVSRDLGINP